MLYIRFRFPTSSICSVSDSVEGLVIYFCVEIFPVRCGPLADLVSILNFIQALTAVLKNKTKGESLVSQH